MSQRIQSHQMKEVSTMRSIKVVAAIVALGLVSLSPLRAVGVARAAAVAGAPADFYDATDLAALLTNFGCDDCDDLDGDRDIDADDIRLMLALFGTAKPAARPRHADDDDDEDKDEHEDDDDDGDDDDNDDDDDDESAWRPPVLKEVPDFGFEWATITHPGNPGIPEFFTSNPFILGRGRVDYIYRMATTPSSRVSCFSGPSTPPCSTRPELEARPWRLGSV